MTIRSLIRIALTVTLTALLSSITPRFGFAQEWVTTAQERLVGERLSIHAVNSGMLLPTPRYGMPAVAVGDSLYVVGGSAPGGFQGDIVRITPSTKTVTTVTKKLLPRRYHAAAAVGRFIYVFGGVSPVDGPTNISDIVERFDTRTGEIQELAPMPTPLRLAGAVTVGKKIYVIGGSDRAGKYAGTVAIYNTEVNIWTQGPPMPAPRECAFAFRDGNIYAVGGFNGVKAMTNFDVYNIASKTWKSLPPLPFTMSAHHIALLNDHLYAFGDFNVADRGIVYDFEQQCWGPLLDTGFVGSRNNPVAALQDTLYVIGGNTNAAGETLNLIQSFMPRLK